MHLIATLESRLEFSRALRLMTDALDILDEFHAPGVIGSMLDLAIAKLERFLDEDDQAASDVHMLKSKLEREFVDTSVVGERKPIPWEIPPE